MKFFLFLILLSTFAFANERELSRKVNAFLVVHDNNKALELAKTHVDMFPKSLLAHEMLFKVYAAIGDEMGLLKTWGLIHEKFKERSLDRDILEEMSLGILKRGCESESLITRLIGYLAIAKTELPDAVALIEKGLKDTNAHLRSLNVEIASLYGDEPLRRAIVDLFYTETHVDVRVAVLKAIEKLQLKELIPDLEENLQKNSKITLPEKKVLVSTLAGLRESISREELITLLESKRTHDALLACALIVKWDLKKECPLLFSLVETGTKEIKIEAMKTLAHFQAGESLLFERQRFNGDPDVGIMASFALGFVDHTSLEESFTYWLSHENKEVRNSAASALMRHGKRGLNLAKRVLNSTEDLFLKANLAYQLLQLRIDVEKNGDILFNFLKETKEKINWREGSFPYLYKSYVSHSPLMPNLPEATNQTVRLEILNLLSIVEYKNADQAIREFLKETRFEIAGLAAENLLQEGDDSAIILVKKLLSDPDKNVQAQAALLLGSWGKDKDALNKLKEIYMTSDRSTKIKILEALGNIGDEETIPFLIERLKDPSKTIRLVAACILLQILYC